MLFILTSSRADLQNLLRGVMVGKHDEVPSWIAALRVLEHDNFGALFRMCHPIVR
jgi:hypothetical protein